MAFEVLSPLRMVKFCSSRAPCHDQQVQRDCNQMKQQKLSTQSFLSFESYKYKVPCLSCPFCTLLGKSRVWKVPSPMFKLKRSERIWKYLQMFTQHTTICKFAPEVENNSWNLCAKWVTWSSSLMLHGKSYRFCFIVCIFCQKKNVRKQQSYLLPWPILWRHSEFCMPANNSFAFPSCLQVSVTASSWNLDLPKTFEISLELLLLGAKIAKNEMWQW